jgi:hypothetical protein
VGFSAASSLPVLAESIPIPVPPPETTPAAPVGPSALGNLGPNLKLNSQQRKAIQAIGEFALDQMETVLKNGFEPGQLNRVDTAKKAEDIRAIFSSLRLDSQQKEAFRTLLKTARDQMRRQLELGK